MQIVLAVVGVLFGGLSLIAACTQVKKEKKPATAILMIIGSLLLLAAVGCNLLGQRADVLLALLGCVAICGAAIWNGVRSGQFHPQHHIIRIALSLLLLVGFILW